MEYQCKNLTTKNCIWTVSYILRMRLLRHQEQKENVTSEHFQQLGTPFGEFTLDIVDKHLWIVQELRDIGNMHNLLCTTQIFGNTIDDLRTEKMSTRIATLPSNRYASLTRLQSTSLGQPPMYSQTMNFLPTGLMDWKLIFTVQHWNNSYKKPAYKREKWKMNDSARSDNKHKHPRLQTTFLLDFDASNCNKAKRLHTFRTSDTTMLDYSQSLSTFIQSGPDLRMRTIFSAKVNNDG